MKIEFSPSYYNPANVFNLRLEFGPYELYVDIVNENWKKTSTPWLVRMSYTSDDDESGRGPRFTSKEEAFAFAEKEIMQIIDDIKGSINALESN